MVLGIVVVVVYLAAVIGLQKLSGVPYAEIADSEPNLRKGVLVPVAVMTVVLVAFLAITGRLSAAFTYSPTIAAPWLWIVPAVFLVGIVVRLAKVRWAEAGGRFVLVAFVATALVGLSEELLMRGYFVDVLAEQGLSVLWVGLISSVAFGVLHGANVLNGQDAKTTLQQVVGSAIVGLGLFATLALTGSLVLPIVLHALFDFSLLAGGAVKRDGNEAGMLEAVLILAMYAVCLASVVALVLA